MNNYRIDIALDEADHEFFLGQLLIHQLDFDGVEETVDAYQIYTHFDQQNKLQKYLSDLTALIQEINKGTLLGHSLLEDKNWNEEWERGLKSVDVPPFFIKPDVWKGNIPEDRIVLRINPKMAFGTGYHETTRLVLSMIADHCQKGYTVIDAGTGTGVLAIAALKYGASEAFGFDIDPWSKTNAEENAFLNGVQDAFEIQLGSTECLEGRNQVDMVLANINRNALVDLFADISDYVKTGGILILSGLLESDKDYITTMELIQSSYTVINYQNEGEWIALAIKKN